MCTVGRTWPEGWGRKDGAGEESARREPATHPDEQLCEDHVGHGAGEVQRRPPVAVAVGLVHLLLGAVRQEHDQQPQVVLHHGPQQLLPQRHVRAGQWRQEELLLVLGPYPALLLLPATTRPAGREPREGPGGRPGGDTPKGNEEETESEQREAQETEGTRRGSGRCTGCGNGRRNAAGREAPGAAGTGPRAGRLHAGLPGPLIWPCWTKRLGACARAHGYLSAGHSPHLSARARPSRRRADRAPRMRRLTAP